MIAIKNFITFLQKMESEFSDGIVLFLFCNNQLLFVSFALYNKVYKILARLQVAGRYLSAYIFRGEGFYPAALFAPYFKGIFPKAILAFCFFNFYLGSLVRAIQESSRLRKMVGETGWISQ